MKTVIIEDDYIVADHLKMILMESDVEVIAVLDNVEDAIESMKMNPDFYFVDIRLIGPKTGIDLGNILNENNIPFVYVTANNEIETLKKAASSMPLGYITKPYSEIDIIALLEIYKSKYGASIEVGTTHGKKNIKFNEVLYLEADGSYVKIVSKNETFIGRGTLSDFENQFGNLLTRVHRSFLINKEKMEQYNSKEVYIDGRAIPISRSYRQNLKHLT